VTTPEGVLLHTPDGDTIDCLLVRLGVIDGLVVWEAMPERAPTGFGQEPGWYVTVRVLPDGCTIRLCLPDDFDVDRMFIPPAIDGPQDTTG
jgi:hypothetical protein